MMLFIALCGALMARAKLRATWRTGVHNTLAGIRSISPERWFVILVVLLFLAFAVLLTIQPSGVGRGGR